ncbi:MAG: hypothetical protein WDL87_01355 [Candidatus Omnitrophota bacterium]|jgi:hypothetical protein
MKFVNVILQAIIALVLVMVLLKLNILESRLVLSNQNNQDIVNSNLGIIRSNQRLEESLMSLQKQIDSFSDKFLKK